MTMANPELEKAKKNGSYLVRIISVKGVICKVFALLIPS